MFDTTSYVQITTHHTTKTFTYQMNGEPLKSVEKIKYFGVYLNDKLSRHDHMTTYATKQIDYLVS